MQGAFVTSCPEEIAAGLQRHTLHRKSSLDYTSQDLSKPPLQPLGDPDQQQQEKPTSAAKALNIVSLLQKPEMLKVMTQQGRPWLCEWALSV